MAKRTLGIYAEFAAGEPQASKNTVSSSFRFSVVLNKDTVGFGKMKKRHLTFLSIMVRFLCFLR